MGRNVNNALFIVTTLIFLQLFAFSGIAQNSILEKKISIEAENKRTDKVLKEIGRKGKFHFSYSSDLFSKDRTITVKEAKISIRSLIEKIFEGEIVPIEAGKYIILRPKEKVPVEEKTGKMETPEQKNRYTITGYIINGSTGKRISNATIYEIGKTNSVLTNRDGYYSLTVSTKDDNLGLAYSGHEFKDTVIIIQPANHSINMRLRPKDKPPTQIVNKGFEGVGEPDSASKLEELPLVKFAVKKRQFDLSKNLKFIEKQHFQFSLIPHIGTNSLMSGNVENNVSFNLIGGYSYAVNGLEIGALINIVRNDMGGVQLSGFSNTVGGNTRGVQISGFSNNNRKSVKGVQISGFSNIVRDTISGVQLSGFSNILKGRMNGLQIAGFSNVTTENVDGVQLSGFNNYAKKDVKFAQISGFSNVGRNIGGAQVAGFVNYSSGIIGGLQIAGFVNVAKKVNSAQAAGFLNVSTEEITGFQISGFINIAKKVKGFQLGFINIADSVSGSSLGFLSYVKQGIHKTEFSLDENLYGNISFKTGTHRFYNIFTGGMHLENSDFWSVGYGIGTEFRSRKRFYFGIDITGNYINEAFDSFDNINTLFKFKTNFGWDLLRTSGISLGPSFNLFISDWADNEGNYLSKFAPYQLFDYEAEGVLLVTWIGGHITLRF